MNKTKAGERKRTVTVVIGPTTMGLIQECCKRATKPGVEVVLTPLDFIGSWVTTETMKTAKALGVAVPEGYCTHFD
jgi:hypothetical protein